MVREWGMSEAIGPMAWGSQGQVFLGEDLMHTRDYSEDTSKVIDEEVERILRAEEERAMEVLGKHRGGLNAIARALLDNEIIDGREVGRLVDEAHGSPVHTEGAKAVPQFAAAISGDGHGAGNGYGNGSAKPALVPAAAAPPPTRQSRPRPGASRLAAARSAPAAPGPGGPRPGSAEGPGTFTWTREPNRRRAAS